MKLQEVFKTTKDMTGGVVKNGDKFFVDREDINTGKDIVTPGEKISFAHKGKKLFATVSDRGTGRNDDTYELDLIS